MKHITQTFEKLFFCYNPQEFFAVKVDGKLANRGQFATYKLRKLAQGRLY